MHNKPTISQTILMPNMYLNPVLNAPLGPDGLPVQVAPEDVMEHYEVCVGSSKQQGGMSRWHFHE